MSKLRKLWSIIYWALVQLFYLFCVYGIATWLWPITYPLHDWLSKLKNQKLNPLRWMIHVHPYGTAWYWLKWDYNLGIDGSYTNYIMLDEARTTAPIWKRFIIAYKWSVWRNGCWPLMDGLLTQKQGDKTDIEIVRHDNEEYSVFMPCRMKFQNEAGEFTDNIGDYFCMDKTILGHSMSWYKIDGAQYWFWTGCNIKPSPEDGENIWKGTEWMIGWSGTRPIMRYKGNKLRIMP